MNTTLFRTTVIASVVALFASAAMVQAAETNTLLELKDRCICDAPNENKRFGIYTPLLAGG